MSDMVTIDLSPKVIYEGDTISVAIGDKTYGPVDRVGAFAALKDEIMTAHPDMFENSQAYEYSMMTLHFANMARRGK